MFEKRAAPLVLKKAVGNSLVTDRGRSGRRRERRKVMLVVDGVIQQFLSASQDVASTSSSRKPAAKTNHEDQNRAFVSLTIKTSDKIQNTLFQNTPESGAQGNSHNGIICTSRRTITIYGVLDEAVRLHKLL